MRRLLLALGLAPAAAFAEPAAFSIPAEPADQAILAFSKQAGLQVLFPFDELRKVRSTAVAGSYEPGDALALLLKGTGFAARPNESGAIVIAAAAPSGVAGPRPARPAAAASQGPENPTRLAPFLVKGQPEEGPRTATAYESAGGNLDLPRTENDALPFEVYDRSEIVMSGAISLDDFLRQKVLESDAATPPLEEGGAQPGFLVGSTNLNLRAYGSDETLVLVNGLPLPQMLSGGITNGSLNTSRSPDVNLIPIDLVERVEVLPVSASALYSGNPVGGVINIVLRPIEDITELGAAWSDGLDGAGAPQVSLSLLHGQTLDGGRLRLRLNANFTRVVPPTEAGLGYIRANLAAHPDLSTPPLYRATPNVVSDSGTPLFGPGTPDSTSVAPGTSGAGGLAAFSGRQGLASLGLFSAPGDDASDPSSLQYAYGRRQESASWFGSASYDVFPGIEASLDGLYSHTVTHPGYDILQGDLMLPSTSPANPFGQAVDVTLNETAPLLGQGYDQGSIDYCSAVAGLLAKLPGNWRLALDAQYSHSTTQYRGLSGVDPVRWQQLVDEGAYNPLRDTQAYGPPPQFYSQVLTYFGMPGQFVTLDDYQTFDAAGRLANESLALPTGTGAATLGVDYSIESLADFNDAQFHGDGTSADTSGLWVGRTLQQVSAFGELQAPLVPDSWLPAWIKHAGLDLSARYNASDSPLGHNIAPVFGLKLDFPAGISARASVSTTNRFPTPFTSGFVASPGGSGTTAPAIAGIPIVDPRRGDSTYDIVTTDVPDTSLTPEADITRSFGLVFQHGRTNKLRLSIDFFDTRKSGEVAYLDAQDILTYENLYPGRVIRAAAVPGDPYGVGPVTSILTGEINLAWRHSQDWNIAADYDWTGLCGGTLQLYARWVYFQRYDREELPNTPIVDELEHPDTASLDLVRNRVNYGAGWSNRRFGFGLEGQFFSRRILPEALWYDQGSSHIGAYIPFDVYAKADLARWLPWKLTRFGLTGQVRINNIFSTPLPKFADSPTGVEPYGDWRGKAILLSLTATY